MYVELKDEYEKQNGLTPQEIVRSELSTCITRLRQRSVETRFEKQCGNTFNRSHRVVEHKIQSLKLKMGTV